MNKKQVKDLYRQWRKENGNQMPNRAIVKMRWEDDDNTDKGYQVDTIALESGDEPYPQDVDSFLCWQGHQRSAGPYDTQQRLGFHRAGSLRVLQEEEQVQTLSVHRKSYGHHSQDLGLLSGP